MGRLVGGGCRARLGAHSHLHTVETLGSGVPTALGLLGVPWSPHTMRAQKSQDTAGLRGGADPVAHAWAHGASARAGPRGGAHVGDAAGPRLAARLLGCRRA